MKRLALLTTLVSAGSVGCQASLQAETARPGYVAPSEPPPPPPPPPPPGPPRVSEHWVTLADSFSAATNRQFINVLGRGEFQRIRVAATQGAPVIKQVAIEYMDDTNTQVVKIEARVPPGHGQVIDLAGGRRQIRRIVVYSDPQSGGSYSVYGS